MKKIITMAFFSMLLFACGGQTGKDSSAKPAKTATKAKKIDGAKIYKTYCVTCHGLYGDMGASGAVNLATSILNEEDRIQVITKGRKLMTPFEGLLSEKKIKAVAKYIETLRTEKE